MASDRQRALAASRDEARQFRDQGVSEVTPSRRDFAQYVTTRKDELAVIACLGRDGTRRTDAEWVALARACDDAEVAALAVTAGMAEVLSFELMATVAAAVTAPVLRDALIVEPGQLYRGRLHGADAAIFPAADLDEAALHELVRVANSLHMASVIEVLTTADLTTTRRLPHAIVGLRCTTAGGRLDVAGTLQLAGAVPRQRTVLALPAINSPAEYATLCGACDAVVVGDASLAGDDVRSVLTRLTTG